MKKLDRFDAGTKRRLKQGIVDMPNGLMLWMPRPSGQTRQGRRLIYKLAGILLILVEGFAKTARLLWEHGTATRAVTFNP